MSEIKLLPCPFCGGVAGEITVTTCMKTNGQYINKVECFCGANVELIAYTPRREEVVAKWNTRKPMD